PRLMNVAGDEFVGTNGAGAFNQTAGTNRLFADVFGGHLIVGAGASGSGSYNLSGTGSLVADVSETIGQNGAGIFTQTGGTNVAGQEMDIAAKPGSTGTYALGGGSLFVKDLLVGGVLLATGGTGTLSVSGTGVLTIPTGGVLFTREGSTVNLTGGAINTPVFACDLGPSQFHWTGGTLNLTSDITWDSFDS